MKRRAVLAMCERVCVFISKTFSFIIFTLLWIAMRLTPTGTLLCSTSSSPATKRQIYTRRKAPLKKRKEEGKSHVLMFAFVFIVFPGNYEFGLVAVDNFGRAITTAHLWQGFAGES